MRVVCDRKVWRAFVRRAKRRYPKEYIEAAWGTVTSDAVIICALTEVDHKANRNEVEYETDEVREAGVENLQYLGTIHSHIGIPDDAAPSEADWRDAINEEEPTIGILGLWYNKRNQLSSKGVFWPSTKPLDIELQN